MMSRFLSCAIAMACLVPAAVRAQIAGAKYCDQSIYDDSPSVESSDVIGRMHPLVSRARYADAVRNGQWELALRGLRDDAIQAFAKAHVDSADQRKFTAQLDSVIVALPRLPSPGDSARDRFVDQVVQPIRFLPGVGADNKAYRLFKRADTVSVAGLSDDRTKAICWSAMSVDAVLFRLKVPLEAESLARLARLTTSWSNYRTYGYTRQPLELLLFPGSVRRSLPRTTQLLVAHLSLGVELRGRLKDSVTTSDAMIVEFGAIKYYKNYTQYTGASFIAAFASRNSIGYGAMVHVARSLRAGVLFHKSDGKTRTGLVMSTDLYGLLERSKKSVDEGLAIAKGIVVLPKPAH
jgi:hypothetical protein